MKRVTALLMLLTLALAVPFSATGLRAQQEPTSKQELARTKFQELQDRMEKLHAQLLKTDPDQSKILGHGLQFTKEAKIREDLDRVKALLGREQWDEALEQMKGVRGDLVKLLELLQNRNLDLQKLIEEIARLEKYRKEVDKLAKEQGKEKEDSVKAEQMQKQLEEIAKAKEAIDKLLAEQKELRENTNQLGMQAAAEATKPLENKQGELKQDTEKLAEKLKELDAKQAELKAQPNAGQPGQPQPGEPKPGEPKAGSPAGGSGSGSSSGSAGKAAGSMGQAQQQLNDKKLESALKDQDHAIEQLQQAKKELEKMAEELQRERERLPFELLVKAQEKTKMDTDTLSKEMEQAEQPGENGEPKPTPGRKKVQQAVPKQKSAAGTLKEYKPSKAKQDQQNAKEDLEAARDELDERLAQLRQQLQDEVLRSLEERFAAMLAKQKELSAATTVVDGMRAQVVTADGSLPASLVQKCASIADGESGLGVEASDAIKLLEEDGTVAVFPEIVADLKDQLTQVAKELRHNDTGRVVQGHQRDIEDTLVLLINALRRAIEHKEGGG